MKKIKNIIAILLVFVTLSCSKSNAQKTEFPKEALQETVLNTDEKEIAFKKILSQHKGKNIVIEMWASWCGDCLKAMPKMKKLQADHPEASYIFISMDDNAAQWKRAIEKHQLTGTHFMAKDQMKGVLGKALDLDWIPRCIIVDKTGKIVLYRAVETDFDTMDLTLNQLQ